MGERGLMRGVGMVEIIMRGLRKIEIRVILFEMFYLKCLNHKCSNKEIH